MEQPSFDLTGDVALVTGASRGIGHDLVLALQGAGATVCSGVRNAADAPTETVELDLRDVGSIRRAVDGVVERHGKLDVLVNNAGLGTNHDALAATEEEWDDLMAVNLRGLFFAAQAAGRHMVPAGYGRIVNMSSQAGHVGSAGTPPTPPRRAASSC